MLIYQNNMNIIEHFSILYYFIDIKLLCMIAFAYIVKGGGEYN